RPARRQLRRASVSWSLPWPSGSSLSAGLLRARSQVERCRARGRPPRGTDALGPEAARARGRRVSCRDARLETAKQTTDVPATDSCGGRRREDPRPLLPVTNPAEGPALRHLEELERGGVVDRAVAPQEREEADLQHLGVPL